MANVSWWIDAEPNNKAPSSAAKGVVHLLLSKGAVGNSISDARIGSQQATESRIHCVIQRAILIDEDQAFRGSLLDIFPVVAMGLGARLVLGIAQDPRQKNLFCFNHIRVNEMSRL